MFWRNTTGVLSWAIRKSCGDKGGSIMAANFPAVGGTLTRLFEVTLPKTATGIT